MVVGNRLRIRDNAILRKADSRWRCYWHTLRLDEAEHLPVEPGDLQMFRPE